VAEESKETIDALQWEQRKFPPSDAFKKNTLVSWHSPVRRSKRRLRGILGTASQRVDPLGFTVVTNM